MEWYLKVVRDNYFNFQGRAHRKEFWMFALFHIIISIVLSALDSFVGFPFGIIYFVYVLGTLSPTIAVSMRRLHDTGKSGWWLLLSLIPIIGLILLFFYIQEGNKGSNKYGADPHGGSSNPAPETPQNEAVEAPNEGE